MAESKGQKFLKIFVAILAELEQSKDMATFYFSKRFETGILKGITVHCQISFATTDAAASFASSHRIGAKGKDAITGNRWTVVDASFQNYVREGF